MNTATKQTHLETTLLYPHAARPLCEEPDPRKKYQMTRDQGAVTCGRCRRHALFGQTLKTLPRNSINPGPKTFAISGSKSLPLKNVSTTNPERWLSGLSSV